MRVTRAAARSRRLAVGPGELRFESLPSRPERWPRALKRLRARAFPAWFAAGHGPADGIAISAGRGGQLVGFGHLVGATKGSAGVCQLEEIAVDPQLQRQGIGRALLRELLISGYRAGYRQVRAAPLVGAGEEDRVAWLLHVGFERDPGSFTADIADMINRPTSAGA